jgi:hypothetical protein
MLKALHNSLSIFLDVFKHLFLSWYLVYILKGGFPSEHIMSTCLFQTVKGICNL